MANFDPTSKLHVVSASGRKFITFVGLQAKLSDMGLAIIGADTEILQNGDEHESGRWIVKVTLKFLSKQSGTEATLSAIGDANAENTGKMVQPHMPRMAETRGWVRAMRIATRSEYTGIEELGGGDDE